MLKFLTIALLFLLKTGFISGQSSDWEHFQSPLKIPLFLSGNFGELRANHFHAGLDFKTQGKKGFPVYASARGYVSRIKVQSGGYGQAIYLDHPDGTTTVYGHLDRYIPEIQKYVTERQYKNRSYEVDINVPEGTFNVDQGQLIGYSGNTGRSGGPHLHFEIRQTAGQVPRNGLLYHFPVTDDLSPVFRSVYYYAYRNQEPNAIQCNRGIAGPVTRKNDSIYTIENEVIIDGSYLGLGAEVYDFLNGSSNKCGVYTLQLFIDNEFYYGFTIDAISFELTRYINAHMDYDLKTNQHKNVHRLFALPNNRLPIYQTAGGNGIYPLRDFEAHEARIVARDAYGNQSSLTFTFRRKESNLFDISVPRLEYIVEWKEGRIFNEDGLEISIPPGALYQDVNFSYHLAQNDDNIYTDTLYLHREEEALQKEIRVRLKVYGVPDDLLDKLLFAQIDGDEELNAGDGEYRDGYLEMYTRNFGRYVVALDTLAPEIKFTGFNKESSLISFTISDALSGIQSYNGFVDGKWELFRFDSKTGNLVCSLDEKRVEPGKEHKLELIVVDNKGNTARYRYSFTN